MTPKPSKNFIHELRYRAVIVLTAAAGLGAVLPAQALDHNARAIQNSTRITAFLDAVPHSEIGAIIKNIERGRVARYAPEQPVWIIDSEAGTILYYQGQSSFAGQSASLLVDDAGMRFGQQALDKGRASRSTWVRISLGGSSYSAYCHSKAPTIVCSLIP